jgi:carbonic anhydrase/acetyltransferase-like protein (isoleucine patch superfamily)
MYKLPGIYPLMETIYHNPPVAEAPQICNPTISTQAVIGAGSMIIGDVIVSDDVFIGFHNVIRADASPPYYIGPFTNIQDFVIMHCHPGEAMEMNECRMGVYIEGRVSILHQAGVHGPLFIGENTFIGQNVTIYGANIGRNCVVMHGAVITNKVIIADNRFVAPGQSIWQQEDADALPEVPDKFKDLNAHIVDYYYRLGKSYKANTTLAF